MKQLVRCLSLVAITACIGGLFTKLGQRAVKKAWDKYGESGLELLYSACLEVLKAFVNRFVNEGLGGALVR